MNVNEKTLYVFGLQEERMSTDQLKSLIEAFAEQQKREGAYMPAFATWLRIIADEMADRYPDDTNGGYRACGEGW